LTFVPVAAAVVLIETGSLLGALGTSAAALAGDAAQSYQALVVLGNGFILTAVLWGWALVAIIDHRLVLAGGLFAVAGVASMFGAIHSPLPSGALFWPWAPPSATPGQLALAYGILAAICWLASAKNRRITA
jgi:AGZA family xanthine/uracil permease-like MFS transporter